MSREWPLTLHSSRSRTGWPALGRVLGLRVWVHCAIDGKTLRHSYHTEPGDALHAITVWLRERFLVFSQTKSVGEKNESPSVQALIEMLEIAFPPYPGLDH